MIYSQIHTVHRLLHRLASDSEAYTRIACDDDDAAASLLQLLTIGFLLISYLQQSAC